MRELRRRSLEVLFASSRHGFRRGIRCNAPRTVETGAINYGVVHHGPIDISVVNDRGIYICHSSVIAEGITRPHAADKTNTRIAKTIINTTIEADMRTPEAGMPTVHAAHKAPITGSPKQTRFGRRNPNSAQCYTGSTFLNGIDKRRFTALTINIAQLEISDNLAISASVH